MITIVIGVLACVALLLIVVGLHEWGHFISARFFGVTIKQFSIGFGRSLFSKQTKSGVTWHWRLWPLGGFVDLLNSRHGDIDEKQIDKCLDKKPIYQRIIIYLSGVVVNILVAFVAFSCMNMVGVEQQTLSIAQVSADSVAAQAKLKVGDVILSVDGDRCYRWGDFAVGVLTHAGTSQPVELVIERDGKQQKKLLSVEKWRLSHKNSEFLPSLGIAPTKLSDETKYISWNIIGAMKRAADLIVSYCVFFIIIIKQLLVGNLPFIALLGPLGMFEATTQLFLQGLSTYLNLIGMFSVAVALVNLIPLPALDGGAIVYALLEKIRGKPVSVPMEMLLQRLTSIFLIVFLINLFMNDLNRYFTN